MQLDGRVAVVTGGGAETGRAIALRLAAGGALVVVADIDLAAAEATVDLIEEQEGTAAAIRVDVRDDDDIRRMIEFAGRDGGGPHVLVSMTKAEKAAAGPLVPMATVAAAVVAFIGDEDLAGRVVLLRGGRPRRFLT